MRILSLSRDLEHRFSKVVCKELTFLQGLGVEGDAHCGETVQHRSRVKADPTQPNLRQVHLIHAELVSELQRSGFNLGPGTLGENVLTEGLDLLSLPEQTVLKLGSEVTLTLTGLRNPCSQLDKYQNGLTKAVLDHDLDGNLIRKAGVMAIVTRGGIARVGEEITVELPPFPHKPLQRV